MYLATDLVHCQDFYDQGVLEIIAQAKKAAKAKNVEFVGYGLISAMAALQYRQAVKGSKAMIPDPNQLELPAGFERRSSGLADFIASLPEKSIIVWARMMAFWLVKIGEEYQSNLGAVTTSSAFEAVELSWVAGN